MPDPGRKPDDLALRRAMTPARKRRIWERENGVCWMCGKSVDQSGPAVRYDHKLPLELRGTDEDSNVYPLHTEPCDRIKTQADRARIDKMRRQSKMDDPRPPSRLQSRDFEKPKVKRPWPKGRGFGR